VFPSSGPGVSVSVVRAFSILADTHVLYSNFASLCNQLLRHQHYLDASAYYEELDDWLQVWPGIQTYEGVPPLHCNGYKGQPVKPFLAFGEPKEYNGFPMTK
jgi:hypothetical protein